MRRALAATFVTALLACTFAPACKRSAPPSPTAVASEITSSSAPPPSSTLMTPLEVVATDGWWFQLHSLGEVTLVEKRKSKLLARIDGGRFELLPLTPSEGISHLVGHWPDWAFATHAGGGCRTVSFAYVYRWTGNGWEPSKGVVGAYDAAWGDGRILRMDAKKLAWVTRDGLVETDVPRVDASAVPSCTVLPGIDSIKVSGTSTFGRVTLRCGTVETNRAVIWRPGELLGRLLPEPATTAEVAWVEPVMVDAAGRVFGTGYSKGDGQRVLMVTEGRWQVVDLPRPGQPMHDPTPAGDGWMVLMHDESRSQPWRRDAAGRLTKVPIADPEIASKLSIDQLVVNGNDVWAVGSISGGKYVLLHNGKTKSFE